MQCPKCNSGMEDVEIHEAVVERCTGCGGLWFNHSKHEYLKKMADSADIDIGDPKVGKMHNEQGNILCPNCFAPMIRMVVAEQPHIRYESCSKCFSVYFDAGEFRDYVEKDFIGIIKDLFASERK